MTTFKRLLERSGAIITVLAFGVAVVVPSLLSGSVNALTLTNRSLTMASNSLGGITTDANGTSAAAGSYYNGAQTKHTFNFTMGTSAATVKAIVLQYCNSPLPDTTCTAPTGLDVSTLNTGTITSTGFTGGAGNNTWTVDTTINTTSSGADTFTNAGCTGTAPGRTNCVVLTDSGATALTGTPTLNLPVGSATNGWLKNPTTAQNFYVRVLTFNNATTLTKANTIDSGAVAGSTTTGIDITSAVQEVLNFSVAAANTVATPPACPAQTGSGAVSLGTLSGTTPVLDPSRVDTSKSYWRLNTNANNGTVVQYSGDTLKTAGGTQTIAAAGSSAVAIVAGTEKFGMTIDTSDGAYSFTNLASTAPYNTANYAYETTSTTTPKTIASATTGTTVTCDTGAMKYAATVNTTTKPGIYRTSISYFAVPTY